MTSLSPAAATRPPEPRARDRAYGLLRRVAVTSGALAGLAAALFVYYRLSHAGQPADLTPQWVTIGSLAGVVAGVVAFVVYGGAALAERARGPSAKRRSGPRDGGAPPGRLMRDRVILGALGVAAVAAGAAVVAPFDAPALGATQDFPISGIPAGGTHGDMPGIMAAPDGNLWFTESGSNAIGRISPAGTMRLFSITTANSRPMRITAGPDGNIWFTEAVADQIGRISPTGTVREFRLPKPHAQPFDITAGPDGNLWFTEIGGNRIGRISPAGAIREYQLPINSSPTAITRGPDGNLWFTAESANEVGNITPLGSIRLFRLGTANAQPFDITAGPDGNLWFTEAGANRIGRITPAGRMSDYPLASPPHASGSNSTPFRIVAGADGHLWFTVVGGSKIGRMSPSGTIRLFDAGRVAGRLDAIASGPDGNLWFTYDGANTIGRMAP